MGFKEHLEQLKLEIEEWDEELEESEEIEIIEITPELIEKQKQEVNQTLKSLFIGIGFWGIIFLVLGNLLLKGSFSFSLGIFLGMFVAVLLAIHMYCTVIKAVDMESTQASGYVRKVSLIRMVAMILALLLAVIFPKVFHLIGVMLGVLTLKGAALLYPITNKILFNKGE